MTILKHFLIFNLFLAALNIIGHNEDSSSEEFFTSLHNNKTNQTMHSRINPIVPR